MATPPKSPYGRVNLWTCFISCVIWILITCTLLPIFGIILSFRFLVGKIVPLCSKGIDRIIPTISAFFVERKASDVIHAAFCFGFEGSPIELTSLLESFESKVIYKMNAKGQLQWPELQQYPVCVLGYPFWRWDEAFNLKNHIKEFKIDPILNQTHITPQTVLNEVHKRFKEQPFLGCQSPWELLVINNYQDLPSYESEAAGFTGSLLIFHFHHVLGIFFNSAH